MNNHNLPPEVQALPPDVQELIESMKPRFEIIQDFESGKLPKPKYVVGSINLLHLEFEPAAKAALLKLSDENLRGAVRDLQFDAYYEATNKGDINGNQLADALFEHLVEVAVDLSIGETLDALKK